VLVKVTEVTVSVLTKPLVVNSVPANITVCPYVLFRLLAVIASGAAVMVSVPGTKLIV
jgi:hypothetical protein